jgi:hypothetical protein
MSNVKVKELKAGSTGSPRYTLELQHTGMGDSKLAANYDVLAKLIGGSDLLLSLSTALLNLPYPSRSPHVHEFLQTVRTLGLEYRCSKVASSSGRNLLGGLLMGKKDQEDEEVLAYVPNEIWVGSDFKKVLPIYGVKLYIPREKTDASKLFEDMSRMLDHEKPDYFKMILFSSVCMDSIGVFTNSMTLSELKSLFD